jgi:RNA polymerase sigma factor (sigma-70 family)
MTTARAQQEETELDIPELEALVRRVVAARLRNRDTVDDVVQETLAATLAARSRIGDAALAPYAVVTARNLIAGLARDADRHRRHLHRLIDTREELRPEEGVINEEERRAMTLALGRLSERDREMVVAHEVKGVDTATLARELESTPGSIAVRLSRARAKLRVEYLLSMYNGGPPTPRCRPVLVALSAGDRRRQEALRAGAHLLDCDYCAALSEPVVNRRRSLAAVLPLSFFGQLVDGVAKAKLAVLQFFKGVWAKLAAKGLLVKVGAALTGLAITGVSVNAIVNNDEPQPKKQHHAPAPVTCATAGDALIAGGNAVGHWSRAGTLRSLRGETVRSCGVPVVEIPADEGFWVRAGSRGTVWVQVMGPGESSLNVDVDHSVAFRGRVVANRPGFVKSLGLTEGAVRLNRQGHHIEVSEDKLHVEK